MPTKTQDSRFRQLARRFRLGQLLRFCYYAPIGHIRKSILEGGPLEQRRTENGRLLMMDAATQLSVRPSYADSLCTPICYLSGSLYWYQTLFCFYSLQRVSGPKLCPIVYDDGTLTTSMIECFRNCVPWIQVVTCEEINESLDKHLPEDQFPTLRTRRVEYPHLRKLIDIHIHKHRWCLTLDSDVLFFRPPEELLAWLEQPSCFCNILDVKTSYGYSDGLMNELARGKIPSAVNVGLYGLESSRIDWELMEYRCKLMLEKEGPHYLQEQALTALLFSDARTLTFPRSRYIVQPSLSEGRNPTGVMHHYVGHSKRSYFQYGWPRVLD